jgi:mRNA-decapping enzyme subunit 2
MSASKSKGPASEDIQKPPNNPLPVDIDQHEQKESTTPVPASAPFTGSYRPVLVDWSASAPKPLPSHSPHLRTATFTPLSKQVTPASHHSPLSLSRNSQPLFTNGFSGIAVHPHPPSRPTSSLPIIAPSSSTNTVVSHRSTTGHISSFADISPYLSPRTEVPASTKTLRQIALLETVADESARMTSLTQRKPPPDLRRPHNFMHFMPPGSVPPPLVPHNSIAPKSPFLPELSYEPHYIRARTSHAFHHPPLNLQGSADINKNHLLDLMSSPRAASQTPHFHPHVQHVPSNSTHAGAVQSSSYPFAVTTPEVLGQHPSKNTPHYNPNSLLSILNNTRRRSGGLNFQ